MKNPWEEISLTDYENHMKLDSVMQLQAMNEMMKVQDEADQLPEADMVVANLLIEYIGYECFQKAIQHVNPGYVSCIIQINIEDTWVSDSPYLHVFDGLEQVHYQMEERSLEKAMLEIGYHTIKTSEYMLPNGKKLVQIDFER